LSLAGGKTLKKVDLRVLPSTQQAAYIVADEPTNKQRYPSRKQATWNHVPQLPVSTFCLIILSINKYMPFFLTGERLYFPKFHLMLDKLQRMEARLNEKIKGHCSTLEKCINDVDQHFEEWLISLEMARAEVEADRVAMDKQFGDLKLEVDHLNLFLERENMTHSQGQSGILSASKSAPAPPPLSNPADSPDGHRIELHHWDHELGSIPPQSHIPVNSTNQTKTPFRVLESPLAPNRLGQNLSYFDSMHSSQRKLPKINFPMFSGEDP
jgi:hypothetical protein